MGRGRASNVKGIDDVIAGVLRDMPRLGVERLLREKLAKVGVTVSDSSLRKAAEHLLSGSSDKFTFEDGAADAPDIEITDEDLSLVVQRLETFANKELPEIIKAVADGAATDLYKSLQGKWAKEHKQQIADMSRFKKNLERRYGAGLDKLRMLVTIAREWGQENYSRKYSQSAGKLSHLDDVLIRLHSRACQVVMEIIVLLESGLADGAMARWRTLHEITTVAFVIDKHGEEMAERYVNYQIVESKKALGAYKECQEDLGYEPYSKRQADKIAKDYEKILKQYGRPFGGEYGWIADILGQGPKKRVTFADLQKAAGLKVMRAHYQMASYNVHAGPKGVYFKLGELEKSKTMMAGASNAGLVEPAQNAALSLGKLTLLACNDKAGPSFDNNIFTKVVDRLIREIPNDFTKADRKLKRDHRKHRQV